MTDRVNTGMDPGLVQDGQDEQNYQEIEFGTRSMGKPPGPIVFSSIYPNQYSLSSASPIPLIARKRLI